MCNAKKSPEHELTEPWPLAAPGRKRDTSPGVEAPVERQFVTPWTRAIADDPRGRAGASGGSGTPDARASGPRCCHRSPGKRSRPRSLADPATQEAQIAPARPHYLHRGPADTGHHCLISHSGPAALPGAPLHPDTQGQSLWLPLEAGPDAASTDVGLDHCGERADCVPPMTGPDLPDAGATREEAMAVAVAPRSEAAPAVDWPALMHELGPRFAARAADHDANETFVAVNFAELKARGVVAAAVPRELGGGGAAYAELCAMVRVAAHYCGSTALALSMHTHTVATMAWRWRRDPQPVEALLRRVAADRLLLVGSGASDWLTPSATAERVEGGWRVTGQKTFASGAPAGDLFITQAVHQDPDAGPTAVHFAVPFDHPGIEVQDTWRALGMRGTGPNCVAVSA